MVDVSEIARFAPGERALRLGEAEGGKKTTTRLLDLGHWEVIEKA